MDSSVRNHAAYWSKKMKSSIRTLPLGALALVLLAMFFAGCPNPAGSDNTPVVSAGDDRSVTLGETISFRGDYSGFASSNLSFAWRLLEKPASSRLTDDDLIGKNTLTLSFFPDTLGVYVIRLTVTEGTVKDSDSVSVTVNAATGTPRIYIDDYNRLVVEGEPFFPIGIYWVFKEAIEELAGYGFNLVYPYPWEIDPLYKEYLNYGWGITYGEYLDEAELQGVKTCFFLDEAERQIPIDLQNNTIGYPDLYTMISPYLDHPAFLTYYLMDEPENHIPEPWSDPDYLRELHNQLTAFDIHHPTMLVNYAPNVFSLYSRIADILLLDLYPIPDYPISTIGEYTDVAAGYTLGDHPIWVTIQAFGNTPNVARPPTPEELRCMTYLALVHGACGINFFRYSLPEDRGNEPDDVHTVEMWNEVTTIAGELGDLSPVLLSTDSRVLDTANVETRQFEYGGKLYLIAVNTSNLQVIESFPFGGSDDIPVLNEGRTILPDTDNFTDTFDPLAVHVYEISRYVSLASPAQNQTYDIGEVVALVAEAVGSPVEVRYYVDGVLEDTGIAPDFAGSWTPAASGWYYLTAVASYSDASTVSSQATAVAVYQKNVAHLWHSWEIEMNPDGSPQATVTSDNGAEASLEFYEALDTDGIAFGNLLAIYHADPHAAGFNPVHEYWTFPSLTEDYPYIGKATVFRQETPPEPLPTPAEVYDLVAFPSENYLVTSFVCPADGVYSISDLAIRRLGGWVYGEDTSVTLRVFGPDIEEAAIITGTNDMNWVTDAGEYSLGNLGAGERIAFALDMDIAASGDITRFAWTIRRE